MSNKISNKFRSFLAINIKPNLINKILDIQSQLKSNEIISNSEDALKYVKKKQFSLYIKILWRYY